MKKLSKKILVTVLIVAALVTTQYSGVYAQVAQTDQKTPGKKYNKYWEEAVYKEYDLVNEYVNSDEAKRGQSYVWGAIGNKQDKFVKNKSVFDYNSDYKRGYYTISYYTEKEDFAEEDQAFLPTCTITEKNGIITIKYKNLKKFAKKLKSEGLIDDYEDVWWRLKISTNKGIRSGLYSRHCSWFREKDELGVLGRCIEAKKWEYVKIDTRYGAYKGKVKIYVTMAPIFIEHRLDDLAKEKFRLDKKSSTASVVRWWYYIAGTSTVNCIYDKTKNYFNHMSCSSTYDPFRFYPEDAKAMKKNTKEARYVKPNTGKLLK